MKSAPATPGGGKRAAGSFSALHLALTRSGSEADAHRLVGWVLERHPYALGTYDQQLLARYLAARSMSSVEDAAAYVIGWCENADASSRVRPPWEKFIHEAKRRMGEAEAALQKSEPSRRAMQARLDALLAETLAGKQPNKPAAAGVGT